MLVDRGFEELLRQLSVALLGLFATLGHRLVGRSPGVSVLFGSFFGPRLLHLYLGLLFCLLLVGLPFCRLRDVPWAYYDLQGSRYRRENCRLVPYDLSVNGELQTPRAGLDPDLLRPGEEDPFLV